MRGAAEHICVFSDFAPLVSPVLDLLFLGEPGAGFWRGAAPSRRSRILCDNEDVALSVVFFPGFSLLI